MDDALDKVATAVSYILVFAVAILYAIGMLQHDEEESDDTESNDVG